MPVQINRNNETYLGYDIVTYMSHSSYSCNDYAHAVIELYEIHDYSHKERDYVSTDLIATLKFQSHPKGQSDMDTDRKTCTFIPYDKEKQEYLHNYVEWYSGDITMQPVAPYRFDEYSKAVQMFFARVNKVTEKYNFHYRYSDPVMAYLESLKLTDIPQVTQRDNKWFVMSKGEFIRNIG
jgi:hypothetical protein